MKRALTAIIMFTFFIFYASVFMGCDTVPDTACVDSCGATWEVCMNDAYNYYLTNYSIYLDKKDNCDRSYSACSSICNS